MIKISLNNRIYKVPSKWTLQQWKLLVQMDLELPQNWPKVFAIALNKPVGHFINCNEDSLILGTSLIINECAKRREVRHKDFRELTFGEFVDLDIYMVMGIEKNIDAILKLLSDNTNLTANEALYIIDQYANYRISIFRSFANLFGVNAQGESEEDVENIDPNAVARGWYKVIVDLANDDLLRIDDITDQPLIKTLNFMALKKERAETLAMQQLQQKRQHDLQRNNR